MYLNIDRTISEPSGGRRQVEWVPHFPVGTYVTCCFFRASQQFVGGSLLTLMARSGSVLLPMLRVPHAGILRSPSTALQDDRIDVLRLGMLEVSREDENYEFLGNFRNA